MISTTRRFFSSTGADVLYVFLAAIIVALVLISVRELLVPTAVVAAIVLFLKEIAAAVARASDVPLNWQAWFEDASALMGVAGAILGAPSVLVGLTQLGQQVALS
jgi:hypothetical protein